MGSWSEVLLTALDQLNGFRGPTARAIVPRRVVFLDCNHISINHFQCLGLAGETIGSELQVTSTSKVPSDSSNWYPNCQSAIHKVAKNGVKRLTSAR